MKYQYWIEKIGELGPLRFVEVLGDYSKKYYIILIRYSIINERFRNKNCAH